MGLRINTNVASINAQRNLTGSRLAQDRALSKLSSGERITKSADDAAGLAISENLKAQLRGLYQAKRNANDGISLVQTAEGGLNEVGNMLVRLRELGVQAASDTIGPQERGFLNVEYQQLKSEIERVVESTKFGDRHLLNGTGELMEIQVGPTATMLRLFHDE
jgi:flagellin